jgi:hypothetical protein
MRPSNASPASYSGAPSFFAERNDFEEYFGDPKLKREV